MSVAPVLRAAGLSKALGSGALRTQAVADAGLTLRKGELTLLMGPSGSGKSTLLAMLGCIMRPDAGEIEIAGTPAAASSEAELARLRRAHIGYVFQSFNLFPGLTALQNVELGLAVRGFGRAATRAQALAALGSVGLAEKAGARPGELSGGQQQRVAIARAIVGDVSIVLADEPTASLDGATGEQILQILRTLASDGQRAVLIVTHDTRLIRFADRALIMTDGRIVSDGPPTAGWDRSVPTERRSSDNAG